MEKHTSGPWNMERPFGEPGVYVAAKDTSLVCKCYQDNEANARLIAAAPDLLAALKAIAKWGDEMCFPMGGKEDGPWDQVDAAIAKAEGR